MLDKSYLLLLLFVAGLLEAAGKELFQQTTTLTLESQNQEEIGDNKTVYHTVLQVKLLNYLKLSLSLALCSCPREQCLPLI